MTLIFDATPLISLPEKKKKKKKKRKKEKKMVERIKEKEYTDAFYFNSIETVL